MVGSNEATFKLTLEGDSSGVGAIFAAFKRTVTSTLSDIERKTRDLKLFTNLDADLKKSAQSLEQAKAGVASLTRAVEALRESGEPAGKELADALREAQRTAAQAEKDFTRQSQAVDKLRGTLKTAGVDVTNLAAAEKKLADEARRAAAAQVELEAKTALGFKTSRDAAREIAEVGAKYRTLAQAGNLSFGELSTLHAKATQQIAAINAGVGGLGAAFRDVRGAVIGFAAAFAGLIAAGAQSAANYREFSTQIAAIGTIAGVSEENLQDLSDEVRRLAREMGVDAVNSAQALYDIIGSGIPVDNSIAVLAQATKAARAGLTDVHTAASVGVTVLNGYGLTVDKLEHVYDVLFQTVKDGVVSFPELAKNIGNVIPIARAANVPLEELGAAFVVLTRQGIDAPEAATAIARAIQELAAPAPEAAERMRELGIEFNGFTGTVERFSKLNLSLDQINKLIPESRAAKAVLGLSQNLDLLRESVQANIETSGAMQAAYERMAATPQARVERFNAAVNDLSLTVGEFVTRSSGFVETLTQMVNSFNNLAPKTREAVLQFVALTGAAIGLTTAWRVLGPLINTLVGSLATASTTAVTLSGGLNAAALAAGAVKIAIAAYAGFRFGELLYEWSENVRRVGDGLGAMLASLDAVGRLISGTVIGVFTLNLQTLKDTWAQYKRNAEVIAGDYQNAVTGAAEATRAAAQRQSELGESMSRAAKAAGESAGNVDKAVTAILSKLDSQAKAAEQAIGNSETKLRSLVASLQKSVQDIAQGAQTALTTVAASVAAQITALNSFDVQRIRETVAIQRAAAFERIAILQQFAKDAEAAITAEADARRLIGKKSKEEQTKTEQEIARARIAALGPVVEAYRAHVTELLNLQRGHLEKVKELEEQRRQLNQSVEDKIRDIRRQGMTEYQKYSDRINEIDQLTSKARQALAAGDNKLAEEYAKKAIDLAGQVTSEVKEGEQVVVSATRAQSAAIDRITAAQDLLNKSLDQRVQAEKAGAAAAAEGLSKALPALKEYEARLRDVTALAKEGVTVRIKADVAEVHKEVEVLAKQLEANALTVALIAELKNADEALQKAKSQLDKGIPVPLIAETERLDTAIKAIAEAKPELQVDTTAAQTAINELSSKVKALEIVKAKIEATVESNVSEVQAAIDKLKEPTSSTHTVYIETVEKNAAGGLVGLAARADRAVQRFAAGGQVLFRRPGWQKVPGSGDRDTVPALLNTGSFVVRKAASAFYGDGIMARLARGVQRFATGGDVLKPGDIADRILLGGKAKGNLSAGVLADFKETLDRLYTLKENARGLPRSSTGMDITDWAARIIERFPFFDVKRRERIKNLLEEGFEGWLASIETARKWRVPAVVEFGVAALALRRGGGGKGQGTDTVPAMLTPGEWVINRGAVAKYGAGLMHAINNMMVPREALAGMLAAPVPVSRFATGGPVGMPAPVTVGGGRDARPVNIYFTVDARDLIDDDMFYKKIAPKIRDSIRRGQ